MGKNLGWLLKKEIILLIIKKASIQLGFILTPSSRFHCSSSTSQHVVSLAHNCDIIREHHRSAFSPVFCSWIHHDGKLSCLQTGKDWKRIHGRGQLPRQRVRLFLQHASLQFRIDGRAYESPGLHVLHQSDVLLWDPLVQCANNIIC